MHKVWALLALLALVLVFPASAAAAPPPQQPFTASGHVTSLGLVTPQPLPFGFITRGEPVAIVIDGACDWAAVCGATVETEHRATSLFVDTEGNFSGVGAGKISVTKDGVTLSGRFTFTISGNVSPPPPDTPQTITVHDEGGFTVGGPGVRANGTFTLDLSATLTGTGWAVSNSNVVFTGFHTGP